MSEIGVVHLVWEPLGLDVFRKFIASYRKSTGGKDHQLIILFNGFAGEHELIPYRNVLQGLIYTSYLLPRPVLDIAAYLYVAKKVNHTYLCFLNSYSVLLDEMWLAKMYRHAADEGVGLVGATGSYESHSSSITQWNYLKLSGFLIKDMGWLVYRWLYVKKQEFYIPPFPNYHIRTNAFMLPRKLMLKIKAKRIRSKWDALMFESGRQNLTRQVFAMNLQALVVGRDGQSYSKEHWFESRTFRSGDQSNLLIADNRTEQYQMSDCSQRCKLSTRTWRSPQTTQTSE